MSTASAHAGHGQKKGWEGVACATDEDELVGRGCPRMKKERDPKVAPPRMT